MSQQALWLFYYVLLAAAVLFHTLSADFFLDDFLYRLVVFEVANPVALFTQQHFFFEHLHRPLGVLGWWLIDRLHEGPRGQYILNAGLLGLNGWLLNLLLQRMQVPALLAGLAGSFWVAHPGSVIVASWLSDRFDLMAATFCLASLLALSGFTHSRSPLKLLMAMLLAVMALLSKETAVIVIPLALAMFLMHRDAGRSGLRTTSVLLALLCAAGLLAVFFAYRHAIGVRWPIEVVLVANPADWLASALRWWQYLPAFLLTVPAASKAASGTPALILVLLLLFLGVAAWRKVRSNAADQALLLPMLMGAIILSTLPIVQAGHFALADVVFVGPDGRLSGQFFERYYYHGYMGLLLYIAGCLTVLRPKARARGTAGSGQRRAIAGAAVVVVFLLLLRQSLEATARWPQVTRSLHDLARAAVVTLQQESWGPNEVCAVRFVGTGQPFFQAFAEAMVKGSTRGDDRVRRCVVESDAPQFITVTHFSNLERYRLKASIADLPRLGDWLFLRPSLAEMVDPASTRVFIYSAGDRSFQRAK